MGQRSGGSSPLVRGALGRVHHLPGLLGIIPARAGSTVLHAPGGLVGQDHPRSCGEHDSDNHQTGLGRGSSPLVRGARLWHRCSVRQLGIIPARAGSTSRSSLPLPSAWDHPRSCGEHSVSCGPLEALPGSSPLVRGAPARNSGGLQRCGIIPARAGSTAGQILPWYGRWDHPRSCGEHPSASFGSSTISGSSPLVRGAQPLAAVRVLQDGIIPARAGSTDKPAWHGTGN